MRLINVPLRRLIGVSTAAVAIDDVIDALRRCDIICVKPEIKNNPYSILQTHGNATAMLSELDKAGFEIVEKLR